MSILQFLLTFSILSILGSLSIYGFYTASRGQWETTPDGQFKKTGMILKYWSLFWEQYRSQRVVFYAGVSLANKFALLGKVRPDIYVKLYIKNDHLWVLKGFIFTSADAASIEQALLVRVVETLGQIDFVTEIPIYDWPDWIQKPLSSCPPCMSSVFGTPIWLLFLKLQKDAFLWTNYPFTGEIAFGFIFLLTLVCATSILHKKLKF